jgi:exosome complex exonuclease RRP6
VKPVYTPPPAPSRDLAEAIRKVGEGLSNLKRARQKVYDELHQAQKSISMSTSSNPAAAPGPGPASGSASDNFPAFLEKTTAALDALTTTAAGLPGKSDLAFHRTLDRKFGRELDVTAQQVLGLTERLLAMVEAGAESSRAGPSASGPAVKAKPKTKARRKLQDEEDVVDGYRRGVDEVVDGLLEDAVSGRLLPHHQVPCRSVFCSVQPLVSVMRC